MIFLVGWGEGVRVMLERGFFKAGKNMGEVWAGRVSEDFTPAVDRRYLWWTIDDVELLRRRAKLPELIGAESWEMLPVAFGPRAIHVDVRGLDPEAMAVRGVPLAAGRGITRADVEHRRRVVVLGDKVRTPPARRRGRPRQLGAHRGQALQGGGPARARRHAALARPPRDRRARLDPDQHHAGELAALVDRRVRGQQDHLPHARAGALMEETEREVRAILAERLGVPADDVEAVGIWSSLKLLNKLPLDQTQGLMFVLAARDAR